MPRVVSAAGSAATPVHFAQVREDAALERQLCAARPPRRLVVVASGGCTAFSLLDDAIERVYAVDQSPAQCALVELKKAAIAALGWDELLGVLGARPHPRRMALIESLLPQLTERARRYWEKHGDTLAGGLDHCGTTERFYRFVSAGLRRAPWTDEVWRELLACEDLADQRRLVAAHFEGDGWQSALRAVLSKTAHLKFFPAAMFAQAAEHDFADFFGRQFARALAIAPMGGNYFLAQLLYGDYLWTHPRGRPHHLTPDGHASVRRNLHKLVVVEAPLDAFLADSEPLDAFFLSNVFDWADPGQRLQLWRALLRAGNHRARVLFRNMFAETPVPAEIAPHVRCHVLLSRALHRQERSMLYRAVTALELRKGHSR